MKIKNKFFLSYCPLHFSSYSPLQIRTSKTCNRDISKTITASRLRFGQLIEDYLVKKMVRSSFSAS